MKILITIGVLVLVIVIAFVAAFLWARMNPLQAFEMMTRRQLKVGGLEKAEIVAGGQKVVYFTGGVKDAKTIVMVHGVNDQAGSWSTIMRPLTRQYRVVAIDLPGHGGSGPKSGPLPMRSMIDAVSAVIDKTSPSAPVVLVGNSLGGWVSMLYASEHPQRVEHLVLENASGMTWDVSKVPAFPKDREEARRLLRMVHGPKMALPDHMLDATVKLGPTLPQARFLQGSVIEWLMDSRFSKLKMPVTVIWGVDDGILPVAYAEQLAAKLPRAKLHKIDGAAHIPHRQAPGEFTRLLLQAMQE